MKFAFFGLLLAVSHAFPAYGDSWTKSWNVGPQPELRIEASDASVEVQGSDSNTIEAKLETKGLKIGYDGVEVVEHQTGNHIDIRLKEPSGHFNLGQHSIQLRLLVPKQITAVIRTGDGSIRLRDIQGSLRISTGDGSVEGAKLGGDLDARSGDGTLRLDGAFNSVHLQTSDGSIFLTAAAGSKLQSGWKLQTGDGSIQMTIPKDLAADLQVHTGDGSITSNLPLSGESAHNDHELRGKLNGGGPFLAIQTGDGSVSLRTI